MIVKIVFLVSTASVVSSVPGGLLHVSTVSYGILLPSLSVSLCSNTGEYQECYKLPLSSPQEWSNQYCYFRDESSVQMNPSILIVDACNHTRTTVIDTSVHSIHLQIQF